MSLRKTLFLITGYIVTLGTSAAMANEGAASGGGNGYAALGAAIAVGVAAFGGALGQGRAAAAALEGIARNPTASGKIFVPMIIGLALIESLVIYGLLIAFSLVGKA